jgi:hypothetical protein
MEDPNRNQLIGELSGTLRRIEKSVVNKKLAIKACTNSTAILWLVRELRIAMGHKDELEARLVRLRLPDPLFCLL